MLRTRRSKSNLTLDLLTKWLQFLIKSGNHFFFCVLNLYNIYTYANIFRTYRVVMRAGKSDWSFRNKNQKITPQKENMPAEQGPMRDLHAESSRSKSLGPD